MYTKEDITIIYIYSFLSLVFYLFFGFIFIKLRNIN